MRKLAAVVAAALLLGAGTAMAKENKANDQEKACQNLSQLRSDVSNIEQMGPQSTVGQLKQARKDMDSSYQRFFKTADKVARPQTDNLKSSLDNLRASVRDIPETMTMEQAKSNIKDAVSQVHIAASQLNTALNCGAQGGEAPAAPTP